MSTHPLTITIEDVRHVASERRPEYAEIVLAAIDLDRTDPGFACGSWDLAGRPGLGPRIGCGCGWWACGTTRSQLLAELADHLHDTVAQYLAHRHLALTGFGEHDLPHADPTRHQLLSIRELDGEKQNRREGAPARTFYMAGGVPAHVSYNADRTITRIVLSKDALEAISDGFDRIAVEHGEPPPWLLRWLEYGAVEIWHTPSGTRYGAFRPDLDNAYDVTGVPWHWIAVDRDQLVDSWPGPLHSR